MKAYNGGSISNFLKERNGIGIYVTDTYERAMAYANAQATGVVVEEVEQQAEGTIILELEVPERQWWRRSNDHPTLDKCELYFRSDDVKIVRAYVKFHKRERTLYGNRHTGYFNRQQVLSVLHEMNIPYIVM